MPVILICVGVGVLVMCNMYSHSSTTLTEGFPCFFLSCKANARVKLAKTGHGPHSSKLVICVVLSLFGCSVVIVLYCCYLCCSVVICVVLCIVCV